MILEVVVAPVILLLILGYVTFSFINTPKPPNFPPGPSRCPIIGCSNEVSKLDPVAAIAYNKLGDIYGPLTGLHIGESLALLVNGYDVIKDVLKRKEFNGRPSLLNVFIKEPNSSANKTGIMCNNTDSLTSQKSIVSEFMESLFDSESHFEQEIQQDIQNLVQKLSAMALDSGKSKPRGIPIMEILKPHVIRFIWFVLTGVRADEAQLKTIQRIAQTYRTASPLLLVMTQNPGLRMCPHFSGIWKKNIADKIEIRKILKEIVESQRYKSSPQDASTSTSSGFTGFVEFYLNRIQKIQGEGGTVVSYNATQLIETTNDLFAAGAETTCSFLSYGILYMAMHPDIQDNVVQEIDYVIGLNGVPKLDNREKMPYTLAVAEEVLRLSGPVPVAPLHSNTAETKVYGYTIPLHTLIVLNFYSAHMDQCYWGDPEVFRPERFLDSENKFISTDRVLPFGFGVRACPGETLARATFFMFFVALLQHFEIEGLSDSTVLSTTPAKGLTMSPQPFNVLLRPRLNEKTQHPV